MGMVNRLLTFYHRALVAEREKALSLEQCTRRDRTALQIVHEKGHEFSTCSTELETQLQRIEGQAQRQNDRLMDLTVLNTNFLNGLKDVQNSL